MKTTTLIILASLLAFTGCVTVREGANVGTINTSLWKSNAGQENTVEQATDAQARLSNLQ